MIDIIDNINKIIQQFLPGYIIVRSYYFLERPKFKLEQSQIIDSIFISLLINYFISLIPKIDHKYDIIYAIIFSLISFVIFYFEIGPFKGIISLIKEKIKLITKKEFSYDILKPYSKDQGCYIRADLYEEKITIDGLLDYYDFEDDEKNNKYIALKEYVIYDYDGEEIERYIRDTDVILIDQNKLKYLKIYR